MARCILKGVSFVHKLFIILNKYVCQHISSKNIPFTRHFAKTKKWGNLEKFSIIFTKPFLVNWHLKTLTCNEDKLQVSIYVIVIKLSEFSLSFNKEDVKKTISTCSTKIEVTKNTHTNAKYFAEALIFH